MFTGICSLTFLLFIFAFSEIIAEKTKAIFSTTLVIATLLMISFWLGLPKDIFQTSAVDNMGMILVSLLITSMGTTLNFKLLKQQYKTILISIIGVSISVIFILFISPIFIGKGLALAGAPIFSGGNAAALMMKEVFETRGLEELYKFSILMLITQNFIGIPIVSYMLKKEAQIYLDNGFDENIEEKNSSKDKFIKFPKSFNKPSVIMTKLALVSILGHLLSQFTKGIIHPFITSLILGVIFTELGFLEKDILQKTNSATFIIFTTTVVIFSNLAYTTPKEIFYMIFPLIICFSLGLLGIFIGGFISSKIFNISFYMATSLALTCTFGFPTTMLMPEEIAVAIGKNSEEKLKVLNYLLPQMLTAGFVTVTIFSVVVTGVIINFL